jgi:uncharacterized membrane protein YGL010W
MRHIDKLLSQYGESHQNKTNILIHGIAVPSIFFVSIGLIYLIPVPDFIARFDVTFAHILTIPMLMYYFKLSGPIGAAMTLLTLGVFGGINLLEAMDVSVLWFSLILFVVMWILQFVGHKVEGKKPSFFEDVRFLLVGPAWWWMHLLKRLNIQP